MAQDRGAQAGSDGVIVIRPGAGRKVGMVVAFVLAALAGLALINHEDPIYRILAVISLLAGVVGGPWVLWKYSKGTYRTTLRPDGLQVGDESPVIPWGDIAGFSAHDAGNRQVYTTVQLAEYASWIAQLTPQQAHRTMLAFRVGMAAAPVGAVLGVAAMRSPADLTNLVDSYELLELTQGSDEVRDLVTLLTYNRQKYGGEVLITAFQRDRSAEDFAAFLTQYRERALASTA